MPRRQATTVANRRLRLHQDILLTVSAARRGGNASASPGHRRPLRKALRNPIVGLPHQQQPWTKEMEQNWLDSLETRFSGDDIAAFVEGNDWQDWAGMAANQPNPGWLSAVWG